MSQRSKTHYIIALAKQMCYYLTNIHLEQPFLNKQVEYLYIQMPGLIVFVRVVTYCNYCSLMVCMHF